MKNGTIYVKNGTLLREKWHHYVKNGTIYVKNGTCSTRTRQLREKWHQPVAHLTCVKNGTLLFLLRER